MAAKAVVFLFSNNLIFVNLFSVGLEFKNKFAFGRFANNKISRYVMNNLFVGLVVYCVKNKKTRLA